MRARKPQFEVEGEIGKRARALTRHQVMELMFGAASHEEAVEVAKFTLALLLNPKFRSYRSAIEADSEKNCLLISVSPTEHDEVAAFLDGLRARRASA